MHSSTDLVDKKTVEGFGEEWKEYDQNELDDRERRYLFDKYFTIFPWDKLGSDSVGMDVGCGSGRWAREVAPRVGKLICIDASKEALNVAKENLKESNNCEFHHTSVASLPVDDDSLDFVYSLGVLHHIPDTLEGIKSCVKALKPGAPFLIYLYYRFDNRPFWFVWLWRFSDLLRRVISNMPFAVKKYMCLFLAIFVYWPLARTAKVLESLGLPVGSFPLSGYRNCSLYSMKTDALDRFGTRLEHRFTRKEIRIMLEQSGLGEIRFSEDFPYWCAVGFKHL